MNPIDATEHYETSTHGTPPSSLPLISNKDANDADPALLLTIILDTNPHAWSLLESSLPFSQAVANILVFINAHLACNYANEVAVVASHSHQASWLYPKETHHGTDTDGDVSMDRDQNNVHDGPAKTAR